jgi:hypothetical protein
MRLLQISRTLLCCVAGFALVSSMASTQSQSESGKQTKGSSCPNGMPD